MDMSEADPYEQQLRAVFESFDTSSVGSLDHKGLKQLCEQLPLDRNQSADLVSSLLQDETARINFSQFWDGLLNLLGGGWNSSCAEGSSTEKNKDAEVNSDRGDSPEREVSPKLVLGQKKYGRRSRPESSELEFDTAKDDLDSEAAESDSEEKLENSSSSLPFGTAGVNETEGSGHNAKKRRTQENSSNILKGSPCTSIQGLNVTGTQGNLSQAEDFLKQAWQQYGKSGFVNQIELGQVCESIGMEKLSTEAMQQLFEQLDADRDGKVSLDDFLLLFRSGAPWIQNAPLAPQGSWVLGTNSLSGGASLTLMDFNGLGLANADAIVEMWDSVGVSNPSLLLRDLNVDDSLRPLNVSSVASSIEEEIVRQTKSGSVSDSSGQHIIQGSSLYANNLLLAALTLRQAELRWMRSSVEQISCERDKLKNDLAEANYRASLLAQEIDDHHSKLEKVNQNQFKLLEQKHSETIRDLTTRFSQERELLAQQNNRLEQKVTGLQQLESKLSSEVTSLRLENETLDQESRSLTERITECEEAKLQMGKELQEMGNLQQRLNEMQANQEQDRIEHLYEQISKLREENSTLRDRNDELTVELEVLTTRLSNIRVRRQASSCVDGSLLGGMKRRGNSPLAVPSADDSGDEESPRVGKVRRYSQKGELSLDNVHIEGLQIHPLVTSEPGIDVDLDVDDTDNLSAPMDKLSGNNLHLDRDQWLNFTSESSSLVGSQDDLVSLSNSSSGPAPKNTLDQNAIVARLQARIEELERALRLRTSNFGGNNDVKHADLQGLREVEAGAVYLSEEDTPTSSLEVLRTEMVGAGTCENKILDIGTSISKSIEENVKVSGPAVEQLQQHCRDLETQLENVKVQIVKILSEKRACSQENCILKKRICDLRIQLPDSGSELENASSAVIAVVPTDISVSSADNIETDSGCSSIRKVDKSVCTTDDLTFDIKQFSLHDDSKTSETVHTSEIALSALRNRCDDLEKSLTLMRDEYERCEDYWAGKLDEERHLAEQEQRITDEKFSELMAKIREYEELFADDHMRRSTKLMDGRLETIEEQDGLEKQVTELEEELEEIRCEAEANLVEKENEIHNLREQLQLLQRCHIPQSVCSTDIAVQVSDLETGSWGSDRTFIVKPRIALSDNQQENGTPLSVNINGAMTDNVISSTPSISSSSSDSPALRSDEDTRNGHPGAVRNHQQHSRHRRMRHHPHYIALNCLNPQDELQAVGLRLHEQEQTCIRLQRALRAQQQQTQSILQHSWERHKQEVADLQIVLQCTQEKLQQQGDICRDQMNRLTRSDILVKELYVENAHLLASVQNLEERCLLLLQQQASIVISGNCSSV